MRLAAFPKCFMDQLVVERSMSVFDWIEMAADLPVEGLELYDGFFESLEEGYLEKVRKALERKRLEMPMLCCSPDFTSPDAGERRRQRSEEHTSELQSPCNLVCRLLLEKKKKK